MIRTLIATLALVLFAMPAMAGDKTAKTAKPAVDEASMEEAIVLPETAMADVKAKLASGDCVVYDVNSEATRTENGVIAGATLLTGYQDYELSALPASKDKSVVFYCGSTKCTASDKAAVRAIEAGYTKVSVMREGIKGWAAAGNATVPFEKAGAAPAEVAPKKKG